MGSCCAAALELLGVDFCWAGWVPCCDLKVFFFCIWCVRNIRYSEGSCALRMYRDHKWQKALAIGDSMSGSLPRST